MGVSSHIKLKLVIPVAVFEASPVPAGVRTHDLLFQWPPTYQKATGESVCIEAYFLTIDILSTFDLFSTFDLLLTRDPLSDLRPTY